MNEAIELLRELEWAGWAALQCSPQRFDSCPVCLAVTPELRGEYWMLEPRDRQREPLEMEDGPRHTANCKLGRILEAADKQAEALPTSCSGGNRAV